MNNVSFLIRVLCISEILVVEELYKEAVLNTERKLIIFNGELDRIRSGCILFQIVLISNMNLPAPILHFKSLFSFKNSIKDVILRNQLL